MEVVEDNNLLSFRMLTRWGLTVLESCERPSRNVISIHFNTMRSDKRQRHYLFAEEKDCLVRRRKYIEKMV